MKISEVKNASNAALSQAKAVALEEGGDENKKLVDAINKEYEARAAQSEKEEKLPDVRVRAKTDTSVDGVKYAKGQEGKLTGKQFNAVSRHFEKLAIALVLGLIHLLTSVATAQQDPVQYLCQTNGTGGTNLLNGRSGTMAVPASSATNLYIGLPYVARYRYVNVFYASKQMSGTATDVNVAHLDSSPDGTSTNWMNLADISNTAATTTIVKGQTNLDLPNQSYARLAYITNACATIMTNVIVSVSVKSRQYGAAEPDAPVFLLNVAQNRFQEYKQSELPADVRQMLIEEGVIEKPEPQQLVHWRREGQEVASASSWQPMRN